MGSWLVAMLYSVTYCYWYGYGRTVESLTFVLWFPDWVFWGIVAPWILCVLLSFVFAFRIMGDESLGADVDIDADAPAQRGDEVQHG
jgi:hypothetical protein